MTQKEFAIGAGTADLRPIGMTYLKEIRMHYRSRVPVMVLAHGDNHGAAVSIPEGETFQVLGPDRDDRFLVVQYQQEDFLVFASDLHNLCEALSEALPETVSRKETRSEPAIVRAIRA